MLTKLMADDRRRPQDQAAHLSEEEWRVRGLLPRAATRRRPHPVDHAHPSRDAAELEPPNELATTRAE
jgi:hypothetical protein